MNEKQSNYAIAVASLRLAIIQPAFNGTYPDMSKQDYYARVSEKPLKLPDGREVRYSPGTYSCWESAYRKGGFDALMPRERSDKGHCRRLDADAISKIYELRERFPRLTASGIRDRRAFEEEFSTGMYQADTLYGPFIKENGVSRRAYCIMILDDKSRLIVGGKFFYQDNAVNFQKVFRDAVATYGIPGKLYVDNGSPYKNEQLPLICGQLGTVLIHTPIRDGASKGKVERNFRTLRQRFLNVLDASSLKGIAQLNRMLADYIRKHNTSVHSATGMPPYSRYMEDLSHVRMPKSSEWLEECFLHRVKRKVRNDSTVMLDKRLFDVPMEFIGSSVEIRYRPGEPHSAFILQNDKRFPIMPTDKTANSRVKRSNPYNVRYGGGRL